MPSAPIPLELAPGDSLGPFQLGSSLWQVVNHLRVARDRMQWSRISVAWEDESCTAAPILVSIASPPLKLLFEAATQLLVLIESTDPASWSYRGTSLAADEGKVTRRSLARTFGPTEAPRSHPSASNEALITYPGVTFGLSAASDKDRTESVSRLVVASSTSSPASNQYEMALASRPTRPPDSIDRVAIQLREDNNSVLFLHYPSSSSRPPVQVQIGTTLAEDLRLDLGAPTRHFLREDDRLRIHSAPLSDVAADQPAYFASHFDLGLDFMLDGATHQLIKVVLHSNLPGEALFGRYARCNWALTTVSGQTVPCTERASKVLATLSGAAPSTSKAKSSVAPTSREAPLVLDRTADAPEGLAPGRTTELHGFPGLALEVTHAGDIETLWLF